MQSPDALTALYNSCWFIVHQKVLRLLKATWLPRRAAWEYPAPYFKQRLLHIESVAAIMVRKFSCLYNAALCNSPPPSFKDDKSQQEEKMKQRWFLVMFCSDLETFHLQTFISLCGERPWLELALVPLVILPLLNSSGKWEGGSDAFAVYCKRWTCRTSIFSSPVLKM